MLLGADLNYKSTNEIRPTFFVIGRLGGGGGRHMGLQRLRWSQPKKGDYYKKKEACIQMTSMSYTKNG